VLASGLNEIGGLAVDGPFLYWSEVVPADGGVLKRIRR
jgi:hypothetical protein